MKTMYRSLAMIVAVLVLTAGVAMAAMVEGSVASVDTDMKTIMVTTTEGEKSVKYTESTTWPEGVTDPASLVDKKVKVDVDDTTEEATSVAVSE